VPAKAIAADKMAACGSIRPANSDCDTPRKCGVEVLEVLEAWANKPPPFTLK